jgi:hypothetical protein
VELVRHEAESEGVSITAVGNRALRAYFEKSRTRGCLGGASDRQARPAQEDRGGSVTRDDYRTEEKAAGISSLFCCRIGRTPAWGGH